LNDEPIVARPPSASYPAQKFARRNKASVSGIVAVLVSVTGVATATWLGIRLVVKGIVSLRHKRKQVSTEVP
jgi:hypothetical protein